LEALGGAAAAVAVSHITPIMPVQQHPATPALTRLLLGYDAGSRHSATLDDLSKRANDAWRIWTTDPSRYTAISSVLPPLTADILQGLKQFRTPQEDRQRRRAHEVAAHHYFLMRSFFRAIGRYDLATLTADRGLLAAEWADDPLLIAAARWNTATVLLIDRQSSLGHDVATAAAQELASAVHTSSRAAALWGALHLTAGSAAVRSKNLTAAREHVWTHAEPVARKTGEANPLWTQFGPLNVYVIAAGIETEIGNTTEALSLADRVDPTTLYSIERRATFLLELARSHEHRGDDIGVLHYLTRTELEAPEDLRYQPLAASLIPALLLRSRPTLRPDVEALANRVGIQE
jgi:hypothetical protein